MRAPKNPNSRRFKKVIKRGCGIVMDEFNGDWECKFYDWECEECPLVTIKNEKFEIEDDPVSEAINEMKQQDEDDYYENFFEKDE